jgi:hypothetical protein
MFGSFAPGSKATVRAIAIERLTSFRPNTVVRLTSLDRI